MKRRTPYVDEIDPNYRAFRERIIELTKQGYEIKACWLFPPRDGFRHVTVFHSQGKIEFYQPWGVASVR